ncbi:MAG: hypothetical protein ACOY82_03325 [Pseudomonadota bacterium]
MRHEHTDAQPVTLRVLSLSEIGRDVYQVRLAAGSACRPAYEAGQYLKLRLADGSLRAFSIASAPESGRIELQILAQRRQDNSRPVLDYLSKARVVQCRMPYGRCRLPEDDRPLIMIAGGTGISQMKSLIDSSIARSESRNIWLYWGGKTIDSLYLDDELREIAVEHPRIHYRPTLERRDSGNGYASGYPHLLALKEHPNIRDHTVFCSGSEAMASAVCNSMFVHGVPKQRIHCDWLDILSLQQHA